MCSVSKISKMSSLSGLCAAIKTDSQKRICWISKFSEPSAFSELYDAIRTDNVALMLNHAEFLEAAAREWGENPLHVASKHGSCSVTAHLLATQYRKFARLKNNDGYTALHLASSQGDLAVVQLLVKFDSKLCLAKDRFSNIPLHVAVINGHIEVIRELIAACPRSIQKLTSGQETVFHLAAKNYQEAAFAVLLEETCELNQGYSVLCKKDRDGNDVLHIACSNKLVEIVRLLIPRSSAILTLVPVNSLNNKLTPMDILYKNNSWDFSTAQIYTILNEAGGVRGCSLSETHHVAPNLETKNVILVVLGIVFGVTFTTVCSLPATFLKDSPAETVIYHTGDVLRYKLPPVFYLLVFNTAILMATKGAIIVLLWLLPFRPVVLFVTVAVSIVYALLVQSIMPKFIVRFVTYKISSSLAVGLFAAAFICFGATTYYFAMLLAVMLKSFLRRKPVSILPCLLSIMLI